MNSEDLDGPDYYLANAFWLWLMLFASSGAGTALAHGVFGIPLGSVVDVILALLLVVPALWFVTIALSTLEALLARQDPALFTRCVIALVLCVLLPFSAVAAFAAYSEITSTDLAGATCVYAPMLDAYVGSLRSIGLFVDKADVPITMAWFPSDGSSSEAHSQTDIATQYFIVVSLSLAALSGLMFRSSEQAHPIN